jgi:hypothetical protein
MITTIGSEYLAMCVDNKDVDMFLQQGRNYQVKDVPDKAYIFVKEVSKEHGRFYKRRFRKVIVLNNIILI